MVRPSVSLRMDQARFSDEMRRQAMLRAVVAVKIRAQKARIKGPVLQRNTMFQESERSNHRNILNLWKVICVLIMIYHIVQVTIRYCQYEVRSTTTFKFQRKVKFPAFSVCFDIAGVRIPTKFPEGHPCRGPLSSQNHSIMNMNDPRKKKCEHILLYDHPYSEVHNNLTVDLNQYFIFHRILSCEVYKTCKPKYITETYLKPPRKCYKFSYPEDLNELDMLAIVQRIVIGTIDSRIRKDSSIPFYGSTSASMDLYIHEVFENPMGHHQPVFRLGILHFSPVIYQMNYLPEPFSFKCTDGTVSGRPYSKNRCIETCIRSASNQSFIQLTYSNFNSLDFLSKNNSGYYILYNHCSKKCPLACLTRIFSMSSKAITNTYNSTLGITIQHDQMMFESKFLEKISSSRIFSICFFHIEFMDRLRSVSSGNIWRGNWL